MLHTVILAVLVIVSVQVEAGSSPADDAMTSQSRREPNVLCGGLDVAGCAYANRMLHDSLLRLPLCPEGWRWVAVDKSHWHDIASQLHVADTVPAFSNFTLRTTYINQAFFSIAARPEELLQPYGSPRGAAGLDWVLSHELGHIVCNTANERIAESAGRRIRFGLREKKQICFIG